MYIEKRWAIPAALTFLLLGALLALVLLLRGSGASQASGRARSADLASVESRSNAPGSAGQAPGSGPPQAVVPAAEPATVANGVPGAQDTHVAAPAAVVVDAPLGTTAPEEVVAIGTVGSDDTQINTRGFGDIGLQFNDVKNTAPVTIVHVSSSGNNNTTNITIGNNDQIVSQQDHLESNRTDGAAPASVESATATATP